MQGDATLVIGDIGSYPGILPPGEPVNARHFGTNYGSDATSASAQLDSRSLYNNLTSLVSTPITNACVGST